MRSILTVLFCVSCLAVAPAMAEEPMADARIGPPPEFEYLKMTPLNLPIITEKGLTQQVSVAVSLEIPFGKLDEVKAMQPKLIDAYLSDLYGAMGSGAGLSKGNIVNVPVIKQRLALKTDKVLGEGKVHDVLIDVVQQSPR